jgi:predicted site-specific integrase-resolvase
VSSRTVYRWVEDGKLHFTETSDARLLICRESIPTIRDSSGEILQPAIRRERN